MAQSLLRQLYLCVGYGSLAVAVLGVVLPLLPTTPFLLLAVWAFSRSDPRLVEWVLRQPYLGPLLRDWREEGAIPLSAKCFALATLITSWLLVATTATTALVPIILGAVMGSVAVYIVTRPLPGRSRVGR